MSVVTRTRWLIPGTIALAVAQCVLWLFLAYAMWSVRGLLLPPSSPQEGDNSRFALALLAIAGINCLAVIVYLSRRSRYGSVALAAVQLVNVGAALWASIGRDNFGWLLLGAPLAAITLLFLLLIRRTPAASST